MGLQSQNRARAGAGQEVEIPVEEVLVGDVVLVRPGDKIPVDGEDHRRALRCGRVHGDG